MAPTICMSELPMVRSSKNFYSQKRQEIYSRVDKQQRLKLKQVTNGTISLTKLKNVNPLWEINTSSSSATSITSSHDTIENSKEHRNVVLARHEGLLSIIIETMALVRRSHILQKRVNALRTETQEFIKSVLNNPENKHKQNLLLNYCNDSTVSSSTEKVISKVTLSTCTPDSTSSSINAVTSTCCNSSWDKEEVLEESQMSLCSI